MTDAAKRRRRWPLVVLAGLAVAVLAAVLVLPGLLNVERYRPMIERALEDATGWEADLGEIDFSLLRGALTVRRASLEAPGGDTSSVAIGRIEINARLMALLRNELDVRSVAIVDPEIRLVQPGETRGWVMPSSGGTDDAPSASPEGARNTDPASGGGFRVVVGEIRLRNGSVEIEDRSMDPPWIFRIGDVNATLSPATDEATGTLRLGDGQGSASWQGSLARGLAVRLEDLETELLHPFLGPELIRGGGKLSGDVTLELPLAVSGSLTAEGLVLMSGTRPFDEAGLDFAIALRGAGWELERLEFRGDGARLTGGGPLTPTLALSLALPKTPLESALRAAESVLPLPVDVEGPGQVEAAVQVDQPVGGELTYEAHGTLSAGRIRPGELLPSAQEVQATFELDRQGVLAIDVERCTIAGGAVSGGAEIDGVDPPGKLSFRGGLRDAVFGRLLGGMVSEAREVTGPTGFDAALGLDLSREALDARALSGRVDFRARELALPGWDLAQVIQAKLEEKLGSGEGSNAAGVESIARLVDSVEGGLNFDRWPWGVEGLRLAVGDFDASGDGTFNPETGEVEFELVTKLSESRTDRLVARNRELRLLVDRQGRLSLPMQIQGSMMSPSIRVELDDALKDNLLGDDPERAVKDLLKGLLGRD